LQTPPAPYPREDRRDREGVQNREDVRRSQEDADDGGEEGRRREVVVGAGEG